jgi:hypothetical protein
MHFALAVFITISSVTKWTVSAAFFRFTFFASTYDPALTAIFTSWS